MRFAVAILLLSLASLAFAQEEKEPAPPPILVVNYDLPEDVPVGKEFTFTAKLKNNVGRLALVSVRLQLGDNFLVLPPSAEQSIFVEADTPRTVAWRVKRVAEGKLSGNIESYLITVKLGAVTAVPQDDKTILEQEWNGIFTDAKSEFSARLRLRVHPDGGVEGRILWKLLKHQTESQKKLIGREGIEFVWGSYDPEKRLLLVDGYRRDDSLNVIGLDRYRLAIKAAGTQLEGSSWSHGRNDGRLLFTPVEEK